MEKNVLIHRRITWFFVQQNSAIPFFLSLSYVNKYIHLRNIHIRRNDEIIVFLFVGLHFEIVHFRGIFWRESGSCGYKMFVPFCFEKGPQTMTSLSYRRVIFVEGFTIIKHQVNIFTVIIFVFVTEI